MRHVLPTHRRSIHLPQTALTKCREDVHVRFDLNDFHLSTLQRAKKNVEDQIRESNVPQRHQVLQHDLAVEEKS